MSYNGTLELTASKRQQKTIIGNCYYDGALKITRPVYFDGSGSAAIYLIHVGGGYVDGDAYHVQVGVEEGAELAVTTQSSTKVYRTPNEAVQQFTNISLKKGSILEYFPDPLIAYEGAKFIQETRVDLEDDATLFYSDIITPGWAADGSLFQYDWIRSKLKIYREGQLVVFDHLLLEREQEKAATVAVDLLKMGGYSHVGSLFIVHSEVDKAFVEQLADYLDSYGEGARFGISLLPISGCILRLLGGSTGEIDTMIQKAHEFSRRQLLGKDPVYWRKY